MSTSDRILNVLQHVFENENIDMNCSQNNCEMWDSLKHLNLVVELESEFDIELEPEEIAIMTNFNAIRQIIELKLD